MLPRRITEGISILVSFPVTKGLCWIVRRRTRAGRCMGYTDKSFNKLLSSGMAAVAVAPEHSQARGIGIERDGHGAGESARVTEVPVLQVTA